MCFALLPTMDDDATASSVTLSNMAADKSAYHDENMHDSNITCDTESVDWLAVRRERNQPKQCCDILVLVTIMLMTVLALSLCRHRKTT